LLSVVLRFDQSAFRQPPDLVGGHAQNLRRLAGTEANLGHGATSGHSLAAFDKFLKNLFANR
jgi:hypothetical protein